MTVVSLSLFFVVIIIQKYQISYSPFKVSETYSSILESRIMKISKQILSCYDVCFLITHELNICYVPPVTP